jgi:hypothetical protein
MPHDNNNSTKKKLFETTSKYTGLTQNLFNIHCLKFSSLEQILASRKTRKTIPKTEYSRYINDVLSRY